MKQSQWLLSIIVAAFATSIFIMTIFIAPQSNDHGYDSIASMTLNDSSEEQIGSSDSFELIFVGDMMFDRYIRQTQEPSKYMNILSDELLNWLQSSSAVIGNLEGPITDEASLTTYDQSNPNHYRFTFDPAITSFLNQANIQAVSIGNNHSTNFGKSGITETIYYLDQAGIENFGNPYINTNVGTLNMNGLRVGFVAYNYADSIPILVVLENITHAKTSHDLVIVMPHWGSEYETNPNETQKSLAANFVLAGADLVIGSHPHVVQNTSKINDIPIYYSLGNFIFDQYFDNSVRCGLAVKLRFDNTGTSEIDQRWVWLASDGTTEFANKNQCGHLLQDSNNNG